VFYDVFRYSGTGFGLWGQMNVNMKTGRKRKVCGKSPPRGTIGKATSIKFKFKK